MKVRSSLRRICDACKLVRRGRKQFVICAVNARHKQRQRSGAGFATLAGPSEGEAVESPRLTPMQQVTAALAPAGGLAAPGPQGRRSAGSALAALQAFTVPDEDL